MRASIFFFTLWFASMLPLFVGYYKSEDFFDAVRSGNIEKVNRLLLKSPALLKAKTEGVWNDDTALHLAAAAGNNEMVKFLLQKGADVNAKDTACITPLHLAALHGSESVVESLLAAGASMNVVAFKDSDTPLIVAASNGRLNVVNLLLAHGADSKATDNFGKTALEWARSEHYTNIVVLLSK